jgi:hypothetical protein
LNNIAPGSSATEIKEIDRLISEFCVVDPRGTAFRYPEDNNGNPSLPDIRHINLRNIYDVMEKISVILEGADLMINE